MRPFVVVAGARPNFMKIAPLLRALERHPTRPPHVLVHTGQHYDFEMSGVFFEQLGIRDPDVHLEVGSASHGVQTGRIMEAFDSYLARLSEPPRATIVVGDVNSTMACALVASKRLVPVAHVEAGLRCGDRTMPEEINRVVTDAVAELLLVSEPSGLANLEREGIPASRVRYTGNVMIDTLVEQLAKARAQDSPSIPDAPYAVVTLHRAGNVDDPRRLAGLVELLLEVSRRVRVVFPVHPRTRNQLASFGLAGTLESADTIELHRPLSYHTFVALMAGARLAITDSGGIQEETTYLGIPCLTLRPSTERPITVTHGTNVLVGDNLGLARQMVDELLAREPQHATPIDGWDGKAATRVVDALLEAFP